MKESRAIPFPLAGRYGILCTALTFALCVSASAQDAAVPVFKRGMAQAQAPVRTARSFPDTVRVLAIMVNFQQDTDARTTGNGTFILSPANLPNIDPAPHDSAYFAHKLLFLENYFRKSSDGKLIVKGEVIGAPVTLPKPMSEYSPSTGSAGDKPLADLVVESWQQADSLTPAIPFASYDAFIIFHAGVGRDIDLVSLLGFDPTPNDIPSLFVGLPSLRSFLNDPTYGGVPVQNGAFRITHSIILPETETRVIQSAGRSDTLLIGMNGLLASSFGSFLGLPDLFDTQTGNSAIGQFGLMDVASIFSFNGMFPPEPSAWEKIFLGWVEPLVLSVGEQTISLPAVGLTTGADTVYKIPINASEYFLLENRNRDPLQNGQTVTLVQEGQIVTRHFGRDTIGFATTNIGALRGSLIDVEDFDWSLPGIITANDTLDGGILIWHIDESVIQQKLAPNEVNADPARRGVAVEEADGSLDIGESYGIFNPGLGSEFGSPFDCWFEENFSPVYRNMFDRTTFPNSNGNSGARTGITVSGFSPRSPRMTATVRIGDTQVQKLAPFNRSIGALPLATHPTATSMGVFAGNGSAVYAFQPNGLSKTNDPSGLLSANGGERGIAAVEFGNGQDFIVGVQDSSVYIWDARDTNNDGVYDTVVTTVVQVNQKITTAPVIAAVGLAYAIVVGGELGSVWEISFLGAIQQQYGASQIPVHSLTQLPSPSLSRPTKIIYSSADKILADNGAEFQLGNSDFPWLLTSAASANDALVVAAQDGGTRIVGINQNLDSRVFDIHTGSDSISAVAMGDIDLDGKKDILVSAGEKLYAFNTTGATLDGFPVRVFGESFSGSPLIADIDGDGNMDVVSLTSSGTIVAYDEQGRMKSGFPFQTIGGAGNAAMFQTLANNTGLVVISTNGEMQAWELSVTYNPNTVQWAQALKNAHHANSEQSVVASPQPKSSEFFPKSLVYNWPNPVYGSTTQIRYFVSENADVTIKIFDLAGSKITELAGRAAGGIDNEIAWDVTGIQSGVYLAHVEVQSVSKTESAVIKIAVIK